MGAVLGRVWGGTLVVYNWTALGRTLGGVWGGTLVGVWGGVLGSTLGGTLGGIWAACGHSVPGCPFQLR